MTETKEIHTQMKIKAPKYNDDVAVKTCVVLGGFKNKGSW